MSTPEISQELLDIIVCPACHGSLVLSAVPDLTCESCGLVFPVTDGIPVLLVDEARKPS